MTTEQGGVPVYRDEEGNFYVRVPADQRPGVERALAEQEGERDTAGYWGGPAYAVGGLTQAGVLLWTNPFLSRGIIIVGGRTLG